MNSSEADFAVRFAPFVNENNVIGIMDELQLCYRDIIQNANAKFVFFDFALKMIVLIKNRWTHKRSCWSYSLKKLSLTLEVIEVIGVIATLDEWLLLFAPAHYRR